MADDDPFDDFFDEIERMMNEMLGGNAEFHLEQGSGVGPSPGGDRGTETDIHLDIHEAEQELRVVADIPGVEKEAIELKCDGKTLTLDATGDDRTYSERIDLPAAVDEHSASATYNNGVLEVVFQRTSDSTSIDI
jgi:Molecular chaperone (small heat shock protein)